MAGDSLRFGVIADVQYADKACEGRRRYRQALEGLERALGAFESDPKLDFVVQLGDLIDGRCRPELTLADLRRVLALFEPLQVPILHVIGNHDLALDRERLSSELGLASGRLSLRRGGVQLILMDSLELSVVGPLHPRLEGQARRWLRRADRSREPQLLDWNGGFGQEQREWLASELEAARRAGVRTLVCSHHPVHPGAARPSLLAWDADQMLSTIEGDAAPILWLAGHDHRGGHARAGRTHHLTIQGLVEAPQGEDAWAIIELGAHELRVEGAGVVSSRRLLLDGDPPQNPQRT